MVEIIGLVAILVGALLLTIFTVVISIWSTQGGVDKFTRFCALICCVGTCIAWYEIFTSITLTVN